MDCRKFYIPSEEFQTRPCVSTENTAKSSGHDPRRQSPTRDAPLGHTHEVTPHQKHPRALQHTPQFPPPPQSPKRGQVSRGRETLRYPALQACRRRESTTRRASWLRAWWSVPWATRGSSLAGRLQRAPMPPSRKARDSPRLRSSPDNIPPFVSVPRHVTMMTMNLLPHIPMLLLSQRMRSHALGHFS